MGYDEQSYWERRIGQVVPIALALKASTRSQIFTELRNSDSHPASMLSSVLVLAKSDPNGLPGAARLATHNPADAMDPADAMGLTDSGLIAVGRLADLVVASDSGFGSMHATLSAGQPICSDGTLSFPG